MFNKNRIETKENQKRKKNHVNRQSKKKKIEEKNRYSLTIDTKSAPQPPNKNLINKKLVLNIIINF